MADRRSGGAPNRGRERREERREDSRARRNEGNSQRERRSSGDRGSNPHNMQHGHSRGKAAESFNGQAFTESQLMDELPKKKFTGRCRLFVGNLPNEVKEDELKELFKPHGDIAECYLSGKGFAFLRMDTRAHAESAKESIDGVILKGRQVRVRFAVHGAALRVKELSPTVSNEMLYHAFSHFGEVERAVHIVDEKGRPTGEGIVEFERKPSANEAISAIKEKVFLLTACPKPLIVELLEPRDEDDGLAERMIPRTPQLQKERELGPRFPALNSFEFVYGMKWKELYEGERSRRAQLEEDLKESRRRLEADMELAYQDYQAQMLREDLQRRQQELERLEAARRERMSQNAAMGRPNPSPFQQVPTAFGGPGIQAGGPPQMGGYGQSFGGGPMGHPGQQHASAPQQYAPPQHQQHNAPPPHQGQPPQQGGPQQGGRPNVIEGVQRLLQIFKNEPDRPQGGPAQMQGGQFNNGFGGQPGFGGPGGFNQRGGNDYGMPPIKRERR